MAARLTRNVSAGLTGVATGLLGGFIPIIGLAGGVVIQLLEPSVPALRRVEHVNEGVVDGSVALLAHGIFRGLGPPPMPATQASRARGTVIRALAGGWTEPTDSDAMIG